MANHSPIYFMGRHRQPEIDPRQLSGCLANKALTVKKVSQAAIAEALAWRQAYMNEDFESYFADRHREFMAAHVAPGDVVELPSRPAAEGDLACTAIANAA